MYHLSSGANELPFVPFKQSGEDMRLGRSSVKNLQRAVRMLRRNCGTFGDHMIEAKIAVRTCVFWAGESEKVENKEKRVSKKKNTSKVRVYNKHRTHLHFCDQDMLQRFCFASKRSHEHSSFGLHCTNLCFS